MLILPVGPKVLIWKFYFTQKLGMQRNVYHSKWNALREDLAKRNRIEMNTE